MVKKFLSAALVFTLGISLMVGCSDNKQPAQTAEAKDVTMILDYTPNTNHTGLYVALDLGYYQEEGLNVEIIEPDDTSTALVAAGRGQFGVSYQEDVTYALTSAEPLPIKAIATIMQHNTSGFVSLKSARIKTPADFVGKTYAGWGAPSEEAVIEAVMRQDGVDIENSLEEVMNIVGADGSGFASLSDEEGPDKVNILWEFEGWAVTMGRMDGYEFNYIPLRDLDDALDYYTPVIITNNDMIENDPETVKAFMRATKKGYEYAIENPGKAAEILGKRLPDVDPSFLSHSQAFLSSHYSEGADTWGVMKDSVWDNYTQFMCDSGLIDHTIPAKDQYTNDFIN